MATPNRFEVEAFLRSVTGGTSPEVGDILFFTGVRWQFRPKALLDPVEETFGATVDDYDLDVGVELLSITPNVGGTTWTGIANGFEGRRLTIYKRVTGDDLTLSHANASSEAENRFNFAGDADIVLGDKVVVTLIYMDERWRELT